MNDIPQTEIGTGGHTGLEKSCTVNVTKHLTKKINQMIREGSLRPENPLEKDIALQAKAEESQTC